MKTVEPGRRRCNSWVAAGAMIVAATVAGTASTGAAAAPERFVPGFGFEPASQILAAMPYGVTIHHAGYVVRISGMWVGSSRTYVQVAISGPDIPPLITQGATLTIAGRTYRQNGYSWGFGGTEEDGSIWFPSPAVAVHGTAEIVMPGVARVALPVVGVGRLLTTGAFGPARTENGVTFAARLDGGGRPGWINLVVEATPPGTIAGGLPFGVSVRLVRSGRTVGVLSHDVPAAVSPLTELLLPHHLPAGSLRGASVVAPTVDLETGTTVTLNIPVPPRGTSHVQIPFRVGPAKAEITAVRRWSKGSMRLYFRYEGPYTLATPGFLTVHGVSSGGDEFPGGGAMTWIQVPVPPRAAFTAVTFQFPTLQVPGPWVLPLG